MTNITSLPDINQSISANNQSINQSFLTNQNQSVRANNQSVLNQSINQSTNHSINQSTDQSTNQSINQSVSQSVLAEFYTNEELIRSVFESLSLLIDDHSIYSPSSSRSNVRHFESSQSLDVQSINQSVKSLLNHSSISESSINQSSLDQSSVNQSSISKWENTEEFIRLLGPILVSSLGASSGIWLSKTDGRRLTRENSLQEVNIEDWHCQFVFSPINQPINQSINNSNVSRTNCTTIPYLSQTPSNQSINQYPSIVISQCLHQRKSLLITDAANDALTHSDPFTQGSRTRSMLCLPIIINQSINSLVYMQNESPHMFTPERLFLAQSIANQSVTCLENARLKSELQSLRETYSLAQSTNQRELEAAQNAALSAQKLTTHKSEYLAQMSHELRTPMSGVIGGTSLLLDSMLDLTADQREIVHIIRSSGEVMLTLINDILDLSKIEAGRVELEQSKFSFRQCIEQAFDVLAEKASVKRLSFMHFVPISIPDAVIGDQTRLRQILINLLGNAVKFTHQGHVLLKASAKEILPDNQSINQSNNQSINQSVDQSSNQLVNERLFEFHVSVIDSGVGIPASAQEGLFQTFSQVHSLSDSHQYGGSGLGLSISHQLCKLMKGRMWCESSGLPGDGSTFHFIFRAPISIESPPLYLQGSHVDLIGKQLLIVKANPISADLISETCRSWGVVPHCARSLTEAESLMRSHLFHFALIDYGFSPPDLPLNHPLLTIAELQQSASLSRASSSDSEIGEDSEMASEASSTASQSLGQVNGLHIAQMIRRHYLTHSLPIPPIIMLAGLAQRQKSLRAAVDGFLSKPLKPSQFFSTLLNLSANRLIDSTRVIDSRLIDSRDTSPSNSPAIGFGKSPTGAKIASKRKHTLMIGITSSPLHQSINQSINASLPSSISPRHMKSSRSSSQYDECPNFIAHQYPLRILVCEDNTINQKILRKMLERIGYSEECVTWSDNGKSAYEECLNAVQINQSINQSNNQSINSTVDPTLPTSCYHCILMDVFLPVMDGLEATRRIRTHPIIQSTNQPFIIALTASSMHGDQEKCLKAGMDLFLSKPITIPRLVNALKTAYQSINHANSQSVNQSINQSISNETDFNSPTSMRPTKLLNRTTINQSTNQTNNQSISQSINSSSHNTVHSSINSSLNQSINQSITQSINQSISSIGFSSLTAANHES